jgi:hypothetical protein
LRTGGAHTLHVRAQPWRWIRSQGEEMTVRADRTLNIPRKCSEPPFLAQHCRKREWTVTPMIGPAAHCRQRCLDVAARFVQPCRYKVEDLGAFVSHNEQRVESCERGAASVAAQMLEQRVYRQVAKALIRLRVLAGTARA